MVLLGGKSIGHRKDIRVITYGVLAPRLIDEGLYKCSKRQHSNISLDLFTVANLRVSVKRGPDGCGLADADGGWRMGKCGWKNADDKIKLKKMKK